MSCSRCGLGGVFAGDLQIFGGELGAVVGEAPACHFFGFTVGDADDDVAVPGPGGVLIELAGLGWMIGVRVIPADDVYSLFACVFFGVAHVFGRDGETVAWRIVAAIDEREKGGDLARRLCRAAGGRRRGRVEIAAEQCAATFVGIGFGAVGADFIRQVLTQLENRYVAHVNRLM